MKELIMNAFEAMYDFRESFIIVGEVIKEKLETFYDGLGYKMLADGIRGKIWGVIMIIIATLQFIISLPFIPVVFVLIDLPYDVLYVIIYLNHWDID